ncbi:hypothetical protein [Kitasatospora sp. NPDC087315]|uniref:hypothetical protein n=1 Tax=Kitasatospora sp. NPDC087315 TaxID=3364069 RepID=UPI003829E51A
MTTQLLTATGPASPWFTAPASPGRRDTGRAEAVAAYAALQAGALGLHAPHSNWTGHTDGTAQYSDDDVRLQFDAHDLAAGRNAITALRAGACGALHTFPATSSAALAAGLLAAAECPGHQQSPVSVLTLAEARRPAAGAAW